MDAFEHGAQGALTAGHDELGQDLVDHHPHLGQLRQHLGRQRLELGGQATAVRVEPEAAALEPAGQVHLGDPVERELGQELTGGLAPVALVRPDVVEVEQDAAVGRLGHRGDEGAVGDLVGPGPQVADGRLEGEGDIELGPEGGDGRDRRFDAALRLAGREEEGRAEGAVVAGGPVERQVLARELRAEPANRLGEQPRHVDGGGL